MASGRGSLVFSSRRRHTRYWRDWSSDVCSSDLKPASRENGGGLSKFEETVRNRQEIHKKEDYPTWKGGGVRLVRDGSETLCAWRLSGQLSLLRFFMTSR